MAKLMKLKFMNTRIKGCCDYFYDEKLEQTTAMNIKTPDCPIVESLKVGETVAEMLWKRKSDVFTH